MILTGIFGGSFNPIHKGHLAIAEAVVQEGLTDKLWLMVSPRNPLKPQADLWDDALRLRLARAAVRRRKGLWVSDFEYSLPRPSYTYHTLQRLTETCPHRRFVLLIGADNWQQFHKWHRWQDILRQWPLIVYPREGFLVDQQALPPSVTYLDMPLHPISSTQIRQALQRGESVSQWVTPEVEYLLPRLQQATSAH